MRRQWSKAGFVGLSSRVEVAKMSLELPFRKSYKVKNRLILRAWRSSAYCVVSTSAFHHAATDHQLDSPITSPV